MPEPVSYEEQLKLLKRAQELLPQIRSLANEVVKYIDGGPAPNLGAYSEEVCDRFADMLSQGLDGAQAFIAAGLQAAESPSGSGESELRLPDGTVMPISVRNTGHPGGKAN